MNESAHQPNETPPTVWIWNRYARIACSVCAEGHLEEWEVVSAVRAEYPPQEGGRWSASDPRMLAHDLQRTPTPCDIYPNRRHWFLCSV